MDGPTIYTKPVLITASSPTQFQSQSPFKPLWDSFKRSRAPAQCLLSRQQYKEAQLLSDAHQTAGQHEYKKNKTRCFRSLNKPLDLRLVRRACLLVSSSHKLDINLPPLLHRGPAYENKADTITACGVLEEMNCSECVQCNHSKWAQVSVPPHQSM